MPSSTATISTDSPSSRPGASAMPRNRARSSVASSSASRPVHAGRTASVPRRSRDLKGLAGPLAACTLLWGDEAPRPPDDVPRDTVFGPLTARRNGDDLAIGGPKERAVLGTLLAADGAAVSVDALIDAVWPEDAPRSATRTVHSYIARVASRCARPVSER